MKKVWKMERYRDASIQKKLTLSTWLVAIIPIMIIFAIVFFVFINVSVENSKRQSQMLLDKTVEELDSYFAQAQEGMNLMVTDINVQNAIDDYVTGTYKERLDLRDFIRNRLTNMSTVGRRTGAISIYIKEADKTFSRDFSDKDLSAACAGAPWFEALLAGDTSFVREDGDSLQDGRPVWILASNIVSVKNGEVQGLVYVELDKQKMIQPFYDLVEGSGDEIICSGNEIISDTYKEGNHFVPVYSYSSALGQDVEFRLQLKELQRGYGAALIYFLIGMVVLIILIYLSDKLLTKGNTAAGLDELYIWLSNLTAIEYIRNSLKRVRKKESSMILASQNLEDFDVDGVRELTRPLFAIPTHQFLFNAGSVDKKFYMDNLQLEPAEFELIRYPQRGVCLYRCGNERYLLEVHAPPYKEKLFGTAGGR